MEKFTTHTGRVIPLNMNNVDTDMIIPAQFLTNITREGYASTLFRRLREQNSDFPFNDARYKGASILVAGRNFGCGSSREHAVWALMAGGIRVVIAKSFADIFFNNSAKNGLLLVSLPEDAVERLLKDSLDGKLELTADLEEQRVIGKDFDREFEHDSFRKYCLLEGVDELDYILSQKKHLDAYWAKRSVSL